MARHSDPELEGRILRAARKLWHQGGETALSMRAVAKAAGTNTPAVYRRFRSREDILRALVGDYQRQLIAQIAPCKSAQEIAERILKFALRQPREYELITSGLLARMTSDRPAVDFAAYRAAELLGGSPKDHATLTIAVWALVHGMALLQISGSMREEDHPRALVAFKQAINLLVENEDQLRRAN
ncbi:MAG TPA: TetR/AcrR family transcriptional regulator [Terriglobales bacterium]|nr:TetR/AcrR family transcriptional regulator [Terriglobales bacterium]